MFPFMCKQNENLARLSMWDGKLLSKNGVWVIILFLYLMEKEKKGDLNLFSDSPVYSIGLDK